MSRALILAERGRGRTSPNPIVGALVVDGEGVVVGRGSHEFAGGPHAEVHALNDAGQRARGATLYCTLEPCSHTGRTGPCAPRVVQAGIRRAVIAVEDPNPLVAGRGLSFLREHGVQLETGVLRDAAERLNAPFFMVMRRHRPFVTMKIALSRDDRVAGEAGIRTQLTGAGANRVIHRERAEVDAIGVGSGTVLADDPLLTARGAYRTRPFTRVVFDRSLRMPVSARMLSTLDAGPIIVLATKRNDEGRRRRAEALRAAGARVEFLEADADDEFIHEGLAHLTTVGVGSLMLEGGPRLHRSAWNAGLVDRVQIFKTPRILGPAALPWLDGARLHVEALTDVTAVALGDDVMIEGYVHRPD
jgi:diaminohydroxyphosphoribosylaminopyrimidine deaminase / 5-amino-6-(5-phosphoribosylamino)uracil reductase